MANGSIIRAFRVRCLFAVCVCLFCFQAQGQSSDFSKLQGLSRIEQHKVTLQDSGQTYHLFVRLPENYDKTRHYPVVYLLDGGITFPMLSGYYRYLQLANDVPEMIIVGISYGADDWQAGNNRGHDFTAPSAEAEHYGGAENFAQVFTQQFFPLIEQRYSVEPKQRTIFGQSLGGQFVLYALLNQPQMFWGYIASNPALHRNLDLFLAIPPSKPSKRRPRVFVSSGELDDVRFRNPALQWMKTFSKRDTPWAL